MITKEINSRLNLLTLYLSKPNLTELYTMLGNLTKDQIDLADTLPADTAEYLNNEISACKAAIILLGGTL